MKKYILTSESEKERLMKIYKVCENTLRRALMFDGKRGFSDSAKAIRQDAMLHGGILMCDECKAIETFHFSDGTMIQVLPGDRILTVKNRKAELRKGTTLLKTFESDLISEIEKLHAEILPCLPNYNNVTVL